MDRFTAYAQQLAEVVQHLVPASALPPALPTAIVTLIFGVGICVLGAKLARWFTTVLIAVAGLMGGLWLSQRLGFSAPLSALIGALLLGGAAYVFHRLLVGLFTGAFLATVAFSVLSAETVIPHLVEFDKTNSPPMVVTVEDFHPGPSVVRPDAFAAGWDQARDYAQRFGEYLVAQEPNIKRNAALYVIGAGLLGVAMGLFLCRLTLILFTAAAGTSLIGSGLAVLGAYLGMDVTAACQSRPEMSAIALAAFFIVSVVLQAVLTRPEPGTAPAKAKSAN